MPRRMISIRFDPQLLEAARKAARRERRTLSNLMEVALERYLQRTGGETAMQIQWTRSTDGAYEARVGDYALEVWYDRQDPANPGWAWRVTGPGYAESGPADDPEDAMRQAEGYLPGHAAGV